MRRWSKTWAGGVGGRLLGVLAVGATLAAGLTASTPPDRLAQQAAEFDRVFAAYQGWFVGERDERGLAYDHWRYDDFGDPVGDRTYDVQIDYARLGRSPDVAVLRRDRNSRPGYGLDVIHPAGSPEDFVLVGDRYREPVSLPEQETLRPPGSTEPLARALWIARPTTLADAGGWDRCATAGTSGTCILDQAIAATRAAVPGVPRTYHRAPDGTVTARTAVRLIDLVAYDLAPIGAYQLAVLQPVLYDLVPFTIVFSPAGVLDFAELNGRFTVPGATLELQLGQQHLGVATPADFPSPPADPAQIQRMDRTEYLMFVNDAFLLQRLEAPGEVGRDSAGPG